MSVQQIAMPMWRSLARLAPVAVLSLVLLGCADDTEDDSAPAETTQTDGNGAAPDDGDAQDSSGDVPDGVAATVGTEEIAVDTVDSLYDEIASTPAVQAQLEGEQGELMAPVLRSQVLSQLVVQEIVMRGAAEDFGTEVTDEDLEATLAEYESRSDGPEAFEAELEAAGLTREVFVRLELPLAAVLDELESEFGEFQVAPDADPSEVPEGQAALQEWAASQFSEADVAVASEYGTWNDQIGQIEPAGMPEAPAPGAGTPPG